MALAAEALALISQAEHAVARGQPVADVDVDGIVKAVDASLACDVQKAHVADVLV
jgi:hypothetical protein